MQTRKFALIALLSLALIAIANRAYAAVPTEPHDANAMWFEPSTLYLDPGAFSVGDKFNLTLWANSSLETKGWQFWLLYPKTYINVTRAGYTAGDKSDFFKNITTMPVTPMLRSFNATHNRLDYGEAWLMGSYRSQGYGSLCWIEFEVVTALPSEYVEIPLAIKWAYEQLEPPQTYLLYSDGTKKPLDPYDGLIIIPELSLLMLIALFTLATPTILRAGKRKQ